jgi:catechol 2,3-dioxygenase-like lactoylglutathione lyase family enzyme
MARGLDHVVHAVRDLDAAGDLYGRLGFKVGDRNRHPWGTHNRLVQLPGFFVELLTLAEPEKLGADGFSVHFGEPNRRFLARQEGLAMLLLDSPDAVADAGEFHDAGIAASGALSFEREGRRPDGTPVTLGFSVAFARNRKAEEIGFAVCQYHHPESLWSPVLQEHPNSAAGILSLVMVADEPDDHPAFLSAYLGGPDMQAGLGGVTARTARGAIQVMTPAAFRSHFGTEPPDLGQGARLAALRFAVRDFGAALAAMQAGGIAGSVRMGRLVVGPQVGRGATLVFEPA